jgi:hypothetical protein
VVGPDLCLVGAPASAGTPPTSAALCAPAAFSTARLATLYGSPVSAIRWRVAAFFALS